MKAIRYRTATGGVVIGLLAAAAASSPASNQSNTQFVSLMHEAMRRMDRAMSSQPAGDPDKDFVAMMIPHHQGAIDMAQLLLRYGHNKQLARIAQEIIVEQQQEITVMRNIQGDIK